MTFRDSLTTAPRWLSGYWGLRMLSALGLLADICMDALTESVRCGWAGHSGLPDGSLDVIGADRMMPRYYADTDDVYQARLSDAWTSWTYAGSPTGLILQLNAYYSSSTVDPAAGTALCTSVTIYYPSASWRPGWTGYDSTFWVDVLLAEDYYTPGAVCGTSVCGTGVCGSLPAHGRDLRDLVNRWRPARYVCDYVLIRGPSDTGVCGFATCGSASAGPDNTVRIYP